MATSFLPFCAHCEQQIIVPNTSILYCSEKCKRKDQAKPPPIQLGPSSCSPFNHNWITPPLTPFPHDMPEGPPPKNYVEPFSPTPPLFVPGDGCGEDYITRPITIAGTTCSDPYYNFRSGQISPVDSLASSPTSSSNIYSPHRRPKHLRSLTGSSISSTCSQTTPPTQYQLHHQRPLPPLHNPVSYSSSPRSIELVTPFILSHTSSSQGSPSSTGDINYEKQPTLPTAEFSSQVGSLKTLFNFDAIRGRPTAHANSNSKSGVNSPMDRTPDRSPVRHVMGRNARVGGWP